MSWKCSKDLFLDTYLFNPLYIHWHTGQKQVSPSSCLQSALWPDPSLKCIVSVLIHVFWSSTSRLFMCIYHLYMGFLPEINVFLFIFSYRCPSNCLFLMQDKSGEKKPAKISCCFYQMMSVHSVIHYGD